MKHLIILATACALALGVTGCGVAAKVEARNDMQSSLKSYKNCLAANPTNVGVCHGYKLAYDADMRAYRATSAGIRPGSTITIDDGD
jgi:uncharacterized low-complexity protein